jgi:hypothetical protein
MEQTQQRDTAQERDTDNESHTHTHTRTNTQPCTGMLVASAAAWGQQRGQLLVVVDFDRVQDSDRCARVVKQMCWLIEKTASHTHTLGKEEGMRRGMRQKERQKERQKQRQRRRGALYKHNWRTRTSVESTGMYSVVDSSASSLCRSSVLGSGAKVSASNQHC